MTGPSSIQPGVELKIARQPALGSRPIEKASYRKSVSQICSAKCNTLMAAILQMSFQNALYRNEIFESKINIAPKYIPKRPLDKKPLLQIMAGH